MPINRRRSHCFCLLATLALACDTSNSTTTQRLIKPPPRPPERQAKRGPPGTYNLRGTPLQGRTRRVESSFDLDAVQLTAKAGPYTFTGTMTLRGQSTEELEIHVVEEGLIRAGRLSHVLDKTTSAMRMNLPDGTVETETEEELGELHGRVEVIEFAAGRWTRKLVGAAPSAELAGDLEEAPIDDASYPAAAKLGESWTVTGPELRRWLGHGFTATTGQITCTLRDVEVLPAETIATIESVGEFGGTMRDAGGDMAFTMKLKGIERRSLERALEIEGSGQGTLEISGAYVEDGLPTSLSMTGPITIKTKGALY